MINHNLRYFLISIWAKRTAAADAAARWDLPTVACGSVYEGVKYIPVDQMGLNRFVVDSYELFNTEGFYLFMKHVYQQNWWIHRSVESMQKKKSTESDHEPLLTALMASTSFSTASSHYVGGLKRKSERKIFRFQYKHPCK